MIAKDIIVNKNTIKFSIYKNGGTPFYDVDGNHVRIQIDDWQTSVKTGYISSDILALIDDQMISAVESAKKDKNKVQSENAKTYKLNRIYIPPIISMTEVPSVRIYTKGATYSSPVTIEASAIDAAEISYTVTQKGIEIISEKVTNADFPLSVNLESGNYTVTITASNKRGEASDSIDFRVVEASDSRDFSVVESKEARPEEL